MKRGRIGQGFTVVELLVVIIVIGVLVSMVTVTYNVAQSRARDTSRQEDLADLKDALELYYADNGTYPVSSGSTKINASWSTSADASWANLRSQLVPDYLQELPEDPQGGTTTNPAISNGYNYDYLRLTNGWCATNASKPGYLIAYKLEAGAQERKIEGDCPPASTQPSNYTNSEYVRGD